MDIYEVINSKSDVNRLKTFPSILAMIGGLLIFGGSVSHFNLLDYFKNKEPEHIGTYEVFHIGKYESNGWKPHHMVLGIRGSNGIMTPVDLNIDSISYSNNTLDGSWVGEVDVYEEPSSDGGIYLMLDGELQEVKKYSTSDAENHYNGGEWLNPIYEP